MQSVKYSSLLRSEKFCNIGLQWLVVAMSPGRGHLGAMLFRQLAMLSTTYSSHLPRK